jgi:hypothetical protein
MEEEIATEEEKGLMRNTEEGKEGKLEDSKKKYNETLGGITVMERKAVKREMKRHYKTIRITKNEDE